MKRLWMILLAAILLLGACGPGSGNEETEKNKEKDGDQDVLRVMTTVYPLAYFAERIGGDAVDVSSIYPPGADSHTFEPTQKDMMALADSDLFIYVGLGLEGFVENAEKTLKNEEVRLIAAASDIPDGALLSGEDHHDEDPYDSAGDEHGGHSHAGVDPHVWLSPVLADDLAKAVKDALTEERPDLKSEFDERYQALSKELASLDGDYRDMAKQAGTKTFFISHASFGYLASQYGLEQVAVAGLNSQSEPSQKQLAKIVDEAKKENIRYIFFEQNITSKLAEVIRKETGTEALVLHNLSVLTDEDIKDGATYFTLMERNLEQFKTALGSQD